MQRMVQANSRGDFLLLADLEVEQDGQQEKSIDDWGGGRIKIIVGLGDKFSHFVDEESDAGSTQDRRTGESPLIEK